MEEVFKDYFIFWRGPCLKISNTGKLMVNGSVVEVNERHDGRHFFFMHHKWRCLETAMLELFPELRAYYDKLGCKKKESASKEIADEIKQLYQEGQTVEELSEQYKITEDYIKNILREIPTQNPIFLSDSN